MNRPDMPMSHEPLVLVFQEPQAPATGEQAAPPLVRRGDTPAPQSNAETGTGTLQRDQEQPPPQNIQKACLDQLPILLGFVAIFYFLILRPSQKQEKKRKAMLAAVKKGDKVSTTGGMHGVITALNDETVTLRVDKDVKITFDRGAITRVVASDEAAPAEGS